MNKIIKNAFSSEMGHIIDEIYHSISNKIPVNQMPLDKINLSALINVFSRPDPVSNTYNNLLIKALIIVNIILWIALIIIIIILKIYTKDLDLMHIIIENIMIFSMVGIVEFLFFKYIALKFVPVEPSFIKSKAMEILKKKN
jgi:hypothetical protein